MDSKIAELSRESIQWKVNCVGTVLLVGKSRSGKNVAFKSFIQFLNLHSECNFGKAIFAYSHDQPIYEETRKLLPKTTDFQLVKGLTNELFQESILKSPKGYVTLLFLDDFNYVFQSSKSEFETQLFRLVTEHCHHYGILLVVSMQSPTFGKSKLSSLFLSSCTYIVVCQYNGIPNTTLCRNLQRAVLASEDHIPNYLSKLAKYLKIRGIHNFLIDVADGTVFIEFEKPILTIVKWDD